MREIKFRGKRLDNGEWVYGYYWSNDLGNHFIKVTKDENGFCLYDVEVDPATVGQYTGLKEKGGKKIYEGDIIKHHDDILSVRNRCQCDKLGNYSSLWIEVIGNIHDDPEVQP